MNQPGDTGFLAHLEALRQALWRSIAAVAVLLIPGFFAAEGALRFLVRFTCPPEFKLNYFAPMEPLLVQLKLGLLLALTGAMPVILYQLARFVTPALYANERRMAWKTILAGTLLFLAGAALGLFLVVPLMMRFSVSYASEELSPVIGIAAFVNLAALLALSFGIMFQLPILLILLMRLGIVEPETLRKSRPIVVTGIFILAAVLTPPDIISQLLLGIPTWFLFEAALLIGSTFTRRQEGESDAKTDSEQMPPQRNSNIEKQTKTDDNHALDTVYRDSYRKKRRKNRRFGMITGHYHNKRSGKK